MKELKGIITPILTPMKEDESINTEELRNQIERLIAGGVHGIFPFGTNGEGYILSETEKVEVLETTIDQVKGRVPVYAGSGCISTADTIRMSKKAEELGVIPKLVIKGWTVAGFDAELMGYSPKFSSEKLAKKLNLNLKDIDMFEINEAFASQAFAVSRDLGLDPQKVNIYGGGISIGHPIGATGCILTVKVLYELMRTDKKDAMISMCIGGGQGISMYFTKC